MADSIKNVSIRSRALASIPDTLTALNSFRTDDRRQALADAARAFGDGSTARPHDTGWVNVLARTFFSYSGHGHSPARLVWEAAIRGLAVMGCADLDNLGALDEMHLAGDDLGVRVTVSMETIARAPGRAGQDINLPGSPGLVRVLGAGFTAVPPLDSEHGALIASLSRRLKQRNQAMLGALNPLLSPLRADYDRDVLPLAPAGNATPDHIAAAYAAKAKELFPDAEDRAVFWSDVLGRSPKSTERLLEDDSAFMDVLRDVLHRMAPETPDPAAHPDAREFFRAVEHSAALPCLVWLDGQSDGEQDAGRLLDDAVSWGARAVAATPDICWNVEQPGEKEKHLSALARLMAAARKRNLPVLAGSFMKSARQKFVDSFDAPELAAYFRDFTDSAFWLYGHATLQRALGSGLGSEWAEHHFGRDRAAANAFYTDAGKKAAPGKAARAHIAGLGPDPRPGDILDALGHGAGVSGTRN